MTTITAAEWEANLEMARLHQQDFFELLPEWTLYECSQYKYLKQNIGLAIYGFQCSETASSSDYSNSQNISTMVKYRQDQYEVIDDVYNKILECGKILIGGEHLHYGIIYNVMFRPKDVDVAPGTSENPQKPKLETAKQTSPETGEVENATSEKAQGKPDEEDENGTMIANQEIANNRIWSQPVFKVRKYADGVYRRGMAEKYSYDTWYIDLNGRVYRDWRNYKEYNTLSKCTMVLPKDGIYQADPGHPITEEQSTVWLEVLDSPANTDAASALAAVDKASNAIGLAGIALGAAAFLTPIGPAAATAGLIATGINGLWTFGRSSQNLVDRYTHDESVSIADRNAFGSWLGVASSAVGLAASGGSMLISRAVRSGGDVSLAARTVYNSLVIGNLSVSGIGIGYQGYSMYESYQSNGTVQTLDVLLLGTHILFFSNAVVNLQFAAELIESTQGRILDDYRSNLRSKRMRRAFNRARRNAAAGNTSEMSGNAEVIRYINNKNDMARANGNIPRSVADPIVVDKRAVGNSIGLTFVNGKMTVNGTVLIDPKLYVSRLLQMQVFGNNELPDMVNENPNACDSLNNVLLTSLNSMFDCDDHPAMTNIPTTADFQPVIREIQHVKNAESKLQQLFNLAVTLTTKAGMSDFLVEAFFLLWKYAKAHLRSLAVGRSRSTSGNNMICIFLSKILYTIFEVADAVIADFIQAFQKYMAQYDRQRMLTL